MLCQFNEFLNFKLIIGKKGIYLIKFNKILIFRNFKILYKFNKKHEIFAVWIQKSVSLLGKQKRDFKKLEINSK